MLSDLDYCQENAPLAPLTWFRLGGPARVLARITDASQLETVLHRAQQADLPVFVLGDGANLLVDDDGVDGVVVQLMGGDYTRIDWDPDGVVAGGGANMARLTLEAVRRGLAGLECMAGIPGTIGGCVYMNAGGRFGDIGHVVRRAWTIDPQRCRREWNSKDLAFAYRRSALTREIVERVELALTPTDPTELLARYNECWSYKKASQPLASDSAGCIFKNPPGDSAGALIDRAGLKGTQIGGARVSEEHANFIEAMEGTKTRDVLALIDLIQQRVADVHGISLDLEVKVWGAPQHAASGVS